MAVELVIKNGLVVTADRATRAGIAVNKGKIVAVAAEEYLPEAQKTVDAMDKYVLPGLVDPHFHVSFLIPYEESLRTETRAAAAGGVTTIGLFAPFAGGEGIISPFENLKKGYEENATVDAFFHAFVRDSLAIEDIPTAPGIGITSFKFSLGYKGVQAQMLKTVPIDDGLIFEGFEKIATLKTSARAMVHTENIDIALRLGERLMNQGRNDMAAWNDSRPAFVEGECLSRCLYLARVTGCPLYVVHMTIAQGVEMVARAKAQGIDVVAETCPQYLTHNSEEPVPLLKENPALANVNPPLRDKASNEKLWEGIRKGVIDCIGSDQSLSTNKQKGDDIWNAPMGLGNMTEMILPVMLSQGVNKGRVSLEKLVEVCCTNPARVFGIYPKKGTIAVGSDADLVIVDPNKKVRVSAELLHSACDWTIYDGWEFTGWPIMTFLRGQLIVQQGTILVKQGCGRYVPREAN